MSFTQGQTTVFKQNLLSGLENFASGTPYTYKIALYTSLANLDSTTTIYTTTGEIIGAGYTAGGKVLTVIPPASSTTQNAAYISFQNVTWTSASFTTRGALIYNGTTNAAVCVLDFGSDKVASGTFTITFPTATSTTAVVILN
jgi:hypothetical protein